MIKEDSFIFKLFGLSKEQVNMIDEWLFDLSVDIDDFLDFLKIQCESLNEYIWNINFTALVMEYIISKADLIEILDYLDVEPDGTMIFHIEPEQATEIMKRVIEEDRNEYWMFLYDYFALNNHIAIDLEDENS